VEAGGGCTVSEATKVLGVVEGAPLVLTRAGATLRTILPRYTYDTSTALHVCTGWWVGGWCCEGVEVMVGVGEVMVGEVR
jgi:hypothetical protein